MEMQITSPTSPEMPQITQLSNRKYHIESNKGGCHLSRTVESQEELTEVWDTFNKNAWIRNHPESQAAILEARKNQGKNQELYEKINHIVKKEESPKITSGFLSECLKFLKKFKH